MGIAVPASCPFCWTSHLFNVIMTQTQSNESRPVLRLKLGSLLQEEGWLWLEFSSHVTMSGELTAQSGQRVLGIHCLLALKHLLSGVSLTWINQPFFKNLKQKPLATWIPSRHSDLNGFILHFIFITKVEREEARGDILEETDRPGGCEAVDSWREVCSSKGLSSSKHLTGHYCNASVMGMVTSQLCSAISAQVQVEAREHVGPQHTAWACGGMKTQSLHLRMLLRALVAMKSILLA